MRGGFTLHVTMVRENRAYLTSRKINVPWTNKRLNIRWEHFVSRLQPAVKETWTAVVSGPDAKKVAAEMVATLYDRSLEAYLPHVWQPAFSYFAGLVGMSFRSRGTEKGTWEEVFGQDWSQTHFQFENLSNEFALRSFGPHHFREYDPHLWPGRATRARTFGDTSTPIKR